MSHELRHLVKTRGDSDKAKRRLPPSDVGGVSVCLEFVNSEDVLDEVKWKRDERLDSVAKELVEVYGELQDALEKPDCLGA